MTIGQFLVKHKQFTNVTVQYWRNDDDNTIEFELLVFDENQVYSEYEFEEGSEIRNDIISMISSIATD